MNIIWQEKLDLNVIFQKKSFWSAPKYLDKLESRKQKTMACHEGISIRAVNANIRQVLFLDT